jgi:hypothetical protein
MPHQRRCGAARRSFYIGIRASGTSHFDLSGQAYFFSEEASFFHRQSFRVAILPLGPISQRLSPGTRFFLRVGSRGMTNSQISAKYIARSSAIAARMLGGEMMIMSVKDSTFFTLDPVATAIWQAADGCTSLSEIVATRICTEFDVSQETAMADAEQLAEELAAHGILLISDQPVAERPIPSHPTSSYSIANSQPPRGIQ